MPAVLIRQLEALTRLMQEARTDQQRRVLLRQAEMIQRAAESVPEAEDRADVERAYEQLRAAAGLGTSRRLVTTLPAGRATT